MQSQPERFWLRVARRRPRLPTAKVPDCTADENLECPGGRGLALIKAYMTTSSTMNAAIA